MRADRLISILMLMQTHERLTARQMAVELEVSERTIYRDIDALSGSGVPIYSECGPGGGYILLDSYRADLTGLNEQEIRALLLIGIPQPLKELGFGQDLRGALLKLSAVSSDEKQSNGIQDIRKIHLDPSPWAYTHEQVPHLQKLHQALIQDCLVHIKYRGSFDAVLDITAAPLGLVAKTDVWYLICEKEDHLRVIRASKIIEARILEDKFTYPEDFRLDAFWEQWCKSAEAIKPCFQVKLIVSPILYKLLKLNFGESFTVIEGDTLEYSREGWVKLILMYETLEEARRNILGFGNEAEVIEPISLRMSIIDFARQITIFYDSHSYIS